MRGEKQWRRRQNVAEVRALMRSDLERFPTEWIIRSIKKSLRIQKLEHIPVYQIVSI